MAKPATVPEWSTTGTKTAATAGLKADGAAPGTKFAAQHANWLFYWLCQWATYLSDGDFTGGVTVDTIATDESDIRHADRTDHYAPIGALENASFNGSYTAATSGGAQVQVGIKVADGERITGFGFDYYGVGTTADITGRIYRATGGSATEIEEIVIADPAASWGDTDVVLGTPHPVDSDGFYYVAFTLPSSGMRVGDIRIVTDKIAA